MFANLKARIILFYTALLVYLIRKRGFEVVYPGPYKMAEKAAYRACALMDRSGHIQNPNGRRYYRVYRRLQEITRSATLNFDVAIWRKGGAQ